jgi:hypothetical protein
LIRDRRVSLLLVCGWLCGCSQERSPRAVATSSSAPAAVVSTQAGSPTAAAPSLPEDRIAGARSEAQWREHLQEEERERKVIFDHRRLPQHRVLLALLQDTRARYDRAKTPAALLKAEQSFTQASASIQQRLEQLDRWGNSSNLLSDYGALLQLFGGPYPEARRQALAGAPSSLDTVQREVDARTKKIIDWLAYVAKAETEFDGSETDQPPRAPLTAR